MEEKQKDGKLLDFSKQNFPRRVKLKEFTEGAVIIEVGSLLGHFTTHVEKAD